jgi:hypothetical protein
VISPANTSWRNARLTCTPARYLPKAEQHRFSRVAIVSESNGARCSSEARARGENDWAGRMIGRRARGLRR